MEVFDKLLTAVWQPAIFMRRDAHGNYQQRLHAYRAASRGKDYSPTRLHRRKQGNEQRKLHASHAASRGEGRSPLNCIKKSRENVSMLGIYMEDE